MAVDASVAASEAVTRMDSLRAEYDTLREESGQARQAQQSTLQWSLAGIAALFAAGLVFAAAVVREGSTGDALNALAALFGLLIPGYAFCSSLVYVGELRRMERAGAYLRSLEQDIEDVAGGPVLRWERYLKVGRPVEKGVARFRSKIGLLEKLSLPYLGGVGLYLGAQAVSALACFFICNAFFTPGVGRSVAMGAPFLWAAVDLVVVVFNAVAALRSESPDLTTVASRWRDHRR